MRLYDKIYLIKTFNCCRKQSLTCIDTVMMSSMICHHHYHTFISLPSPLFLSLLYSPPSVYGDVTPPPLSPTARPRGRSTCVTSPMTSQCSPGWRGGPLCLWCSANAGCPHVTLSARRTLAALSSGIPCLATLSSGILYLATLCSGTPCLPPRPPRVYTGPVCQEVRTTWRLNLT